MVYIQRQEWFWAIGWSIFILIIISTPYLYGAAISTQTNQFGGFVIGVEDGNSYLAKMRLGSAGGWRFHLFYTSEPHPEAYLFTFHLFLGKVARMTGLSFVLVYHLARLVTGLFLLLTVYYFTAFFTDMRSIRRLVFWLVGLGSGLGWFIVATGFSNQIGMPLDFYSPEAFAFHLLFGLPHLSLAAGLLLWSMLFLLVAWEQYRLKYAIFAGLALFGMTLVAAFYIIIAGAVIGTTLLWWTGGRIQKMFNSPSNNGGIINSQGWIEAGMAALAVAIAMPFPLYNAYVFTTNPIFRIWGEQNQILSPPPIHYLLAFGLMVLLAIFGGWQKWNDRSGRSLLLIGWCFVVPILVYLPFNLQRRLTLGVQIPLSILAALGLRWLWQNYLADKNILILRRWRFVSVGLVVLVSLSNILILLGAVLEVRRQEPPIFHSGAEVSAADWLGTQTIPDEVVLAAYQTGNFLPTRISARVFAGHGPETIYADTKINLLSQFFSSNDDNFRRELLRDYNITYLFYGPREQALGDFSPATTPYLKNVYDNGTVQIYRVVEAEISN